MSETSLFESWWFQNNYPLPPSPESEEKAKKVWKAAWINAIILLKVERTKTSNVFECAVIDRCLKVLETQPYQ